MARGASCRRSPKPAAFARRVVALCLLSLALTQYALRVHAVEHGAGASAATGAAFDASPAAGLGAPSARAPEGHGWDHAAGSAECRLLDQLLLGAAAVAAEPGLAAIAGPPFVAGALPPPRPRAPGCAHQARAPPPSGRWAPWRA